jgi:hypothetical protein
MAFVKLDCGILDSSLWADRDAREIFLTAMLMCVPFELPEAMPQLAVSSPEPTGWTVPAGAYGLVRTAGVGIVRRALVETEAGLRALERLGLPEAESRNPSYDGRRLARIGSLGDIGGGFLVLNYMTYREHDYTAAERSRRYREKKKRGLDKRMRDALCQLNQPQKMTNR